MSTKTTTNTEGTVRLNVRLDDQLNKDLKRIGVETGEKLTVLVPRLLRKAVASEKKALGLA